MPRDLWIPLAGTLAAIVAILVTRGGEPARSSLDGPSWHGDPGPIELRLRLEKDGSLHDLDGESRYVDVDQLLATLPENDTPRTAVALEAAAGVETQRLQSVAAALRARCDVRIESRDDQAKDLPGPEDNPEEAVPEEGAPEEGAGQGDDARAGGPAPAR